MTARDGSEASFVLGPSTTVAKQLPIDPSELKVGSCAFSVGPRVEPDVVEAQRVVELAHGPQGCTRTGGGDVGHLGAAAGEVTAVDGSIYTVTGTSVAQRFTVTRSTTVVRLSRARPETITPGVCLTAKGPQDSAGRLIAQTVVIRHTTLRGCGHRGRCATPCRGTGPGSAPGCPIR